MAKASSPAWLVVAYNKDNRSWHPLLSIKRVVEVFKHEEDAKFYVSSIRKHYKTRLRVVLCSIEVDYNPADIKG